MSFGKLDSRRVVPRILLLPAAFRWRDPATQLVHHGAVLVRQSADNILGAGVDHVDVIIGYTILCTDVLAKTWDDAQTDEPAIINCLECLGTREQVE